MVILERMEVIDEDSSSVIVVVVSVVIVVEVVGAARVADPFSLTAT